MATVDVMGTEPQNGSEIVECGRIYILDPKRIRPFKNQIRKRFRGIPQLGQSILQVGQTTPIKVRFISGDPNYDAELVDGERRLRACLLINRTIKAIEDEDVQDEKTQYEHCVAANFGRQDHDVIEIAHSVLFFREQGKTLQQIADIFGATTSFVCQYLSINDLDLRVQELMIAPDSETEGTPLLSFSNGLLVVKLPRDQQLAVASKIVKEKMSAIAVRRYVLQRLRVSGGSSSKRRLRPARRWKTMFRLAEETRNRFGVFLDMKGGEFDQIVRSVGSLEHKTLLTSLQSMIDEMTNLKESIQGSIESKKS